MISSETVEKINVLISADQNLLLDHDKYTEINNKLNKKINLLKDNIVVSLPSQFSSLDKNEFLSFCSRIRSLNQKLIFIKKKEQEIRKSITNIKFEVDFKEHDNLKKGKLKQLILNSISLNRQFDYFSTLITLKNFSNSIEEKLEKYKAIKKKNHIENSRKIQSSNNDQEFNACTEKLAILKELMKNYDKLIEISQFSSESRCKNITKYVTDLIFFIKNRLKQILIDEFEENLEKLNYPNGTCEVKRIENCEVLKKTFNYYVHYLLVIDVPFLKENNEKNNSNGVIKVLLKPFVKRFKFHFFTNRKTNDINKPEWYLSQIMQWIKDQYEFLIRFIQPCFEKIEYWNEKSALILFINELISLVKDKLYYDFKKFFDNSQQFLHTVDELLTFNNQLESFLNTIESSIYLTNHHYLYTCLHIICENHFLFTRWLSLEKQIWQKYLDEMFSNQSQTIFSNIGNEKFLDIANLNDEWHANSNLDNLKSTLYAENIIIIIKSIHDRYQKLPYPSKQIRFVDLQIDLLRDYHLRLCQILRDEPNVLSHKYLGVLNTVDYVIKILDEWKNSTFYIQMQFYRSKFQQSFQKFQVESLVQDYFFDDEQINYEALDLFDHTMKSTKPFLEIEGTIFDDILPSYEKIKDDIINQIVQKCKWEFTSRASSYKNEKWMSMPLVSELNKQTLTNSASDMLISLRNMLHLLKDSIDQNIFYTIIKKLSSELDAFYFKEIIFQNNFNEGGIYQLKFDIDKYLISILNEFALDFNINNYFRLTNESISLLMLKKGSALLLKELIEKALFKEGGSSLSQLISEYDIKLNNYNAKNALKEMNIHYLTCEQARRTLSLRSDLN